MRHSTHPKVFKDFLSVPENPHSSIDYLDPDLIEMGGSQDSSIGIALEAQQRGQGHPVDSKHNGTGHEWKMTNTPPSHRPAAQKMMSGKYSMLTREATLMASINRRVSERNSKINDLLREKFSSVDHESVLRFAQSEAEFLKKERFEERRLQYTRKMWENELQDSQKISSLGKTVSPASTESEQYDSDSTWSTDTAKYAFEVKSEWEVDPHAAEKWDVSACDWWNDIPPGQKDMAAQLSVGETISGEQGLEDDEEAMPWDEDEDYDSDEAEDEGLSTLTFDAQVDDVHWTARNFEPEPVQNKETMNLPQKEQEGRPNIHQVSSDFFWSEGCTLIWPSHQDNKSNNEGARKMEPTTATQDTHSSPTQDETTFEQAWKTIGRILADVDFEEHMSSWAAGTRALEHRLSVQGSDCRHHRTHRTQAVRDAEWAASSTRRGLQHGSDRRVFNVVAPDGPLERQDAASGWDTAPECPCRGPGEVEEEAGAGSAARSKHEDALRCPFNRRQQQRQARASRGCACGREGCELRRCSRLRTSLAMRDLRGEEATGERL